MKPSWVRIASNYPDLKMTSIDVDRNQIAAQRAEITSIPQTIVLRNGNEVGRIRGYHAYNEIVHELVKMKSNN